jgi:hypothetical protein
LLCDILGIEHRLTKPRTPRTNSMVERFNGGLEQVLQTHRFDSAEDLSKTLHRSAWLYNQDLPQKARNHPRDLTLPQYHRVGEPSDLGQRHVGLASESPAPYRLPHPPQDSVAGSRQEARNELVVLAVSLPRPERESQEGEAHMRRLFGAVAVLAVGDLRLVRVHREPAIRQP